MGFDKFTKRKIFDRTQGYCHICQKKLSFINHGKHGSRGAWHIEHSVAKAMGGSDRLNNLYAACIVCNLEKGTCNSKTARGWNGNKRAPYSKSKIKQIKNRRTTNGAIIGGIVGSAFGPEGTVFGSILGSIIGNGTSPDR